VTRSKKPALTPEHERFVDEYMIGLNATAAYQRAYPGSSYSSAQRAGWRLLRNVEVKAAVKAAQKELRKRNNCEADRVIQELMRLAFSDIEDVMDLSDPANPRLRNRDEIPPESRGAIQEISRTQFGVKVKLASKLDAIDKLMRMLGLYRDLPPLQVLLAALAPEEAAAVRAALAASLQARSSDGK
jgi:phage terminase small subunit